MTPDLDDSARDASSLLGVPRQPAVELVERARMLDLLDGVPTRAMTMLTAPAGYGKSVLAGQWARQRCRLPLAWLELGESDTDPEALLGRAVEATMRLSRVAKEAVRPRLHLKDGRLDPEAVAAFAAAIGGCGDAVLVVDGVRSSGPVGLYVDLALALHEAHDCGLHLLTIGRCAPPSALISQQLRGAMEIVAANDLRLTADEVMAVIESRSGRRIEEGTAEELAKRLEGWMAGVAIVGMSAANGRVAAAADADADELIAAARDGIRGYYDSEVFDRLPPELRAFLLRTSVVDDFDPALCDRLAGRSDSHRLLPDMRARGLPVQRQRGRDGAHRYDRPFRAYLDERFSEHEPAARSAALRSAGDWYQEQRFPLGAADCYRRVGDWGAVVDVVLAGAASIVDTDQLSRLVGVVAEAPAELLREHPSSVGVAWLMMTDGRVAAANDLLAAVRPRLAEPDLIGADLIQAMAAAWTEDMASPLSFAESALASLDEAKYGPDDLATVRFEECSRPYNASKADIFRSLARASALTAGAYAGWWERTQQHLVDIPRAAAVLMPPLQMLRARGPRALHLVLSGHVDGGVMEAERALAIADEAGLADHRDAAEAHLAMGEALRLSGRFEEAREPIERAREQAERNDRRNLVALATASRVHLLIDTGRLREALDALQERRKTTHHSPPRHVVAMLAAAEMRAAAALGDYFTALRIAEAADHASPVASVEVTVALITGDVARARDVAREWKPDGSLLGRMRRTFARALVADASGGGREAVAAARTALRLALAHQLVQPIVEFGAPMARLLRRVGRNERDPTLEQLSRRAEALIRTSGFGSLQLSAREAVVLAQLDGGLSIPAIADEVILSVNTVRTHVKSIYRKLGVNSRAEALAIWRASISVGQGLNRS